MKLQTSQRNELFDLLTAGGLSPENFEWEQQQGGFSGAVVRMRLKRIGKEQHFEINQIRVNTENEYNCKFIPGAKNAAEEHSGIRWGTLVAFFKKWCSLLGHDTAPASNTDKWAEIKKQLDSTRVRTYPTDEQNFIEGELNDLQQRMTQLKQNILTLPLPPLHKQLIETTLDRVVSQADNMNKFDWKSLLAGTIANLVATLQIPEGTAIGLWQYTKSAFYDALA